MLRTKILVIAVFALIFAALKFTPETVVKGQTSLSAPTGLLASDLKYNNKVRVEWDAIRGATTYRVFRNTVNDPAGATAIGATPANVFIDLSAVPAQTYFYWVRAENGATVSAMSETESGTRASATQQGPVAPLEAPPVPAANPITAAKVYLGKVLFWDEQLSSTKTVSCGTCHISANGGSDPRSRTNVLASTAPGPDGIIGTADDVTGSRGVPQANSDGSYLFSNTYKFNDQVTGRKSQSFLNAGYSPLLFWDGRATQTFVDPVSGQIVLNANAALESQVLGPPVSSTEMGHIGRSWTEIAQDIAGLRPLALSPQMPTALQTWIGGRTYPELFQETFGTSDVTPARIAMAIATYERVLYTDQTPLDIANAGITPRTPQEQNGRNIFVQINCGVCHGGTLTTNDSFRYIGVRPANEDTGRFQVTGNQGDLGRFRVPSLRNVELRGTFFHNGKFTTIEQVVEFYNRGGDFNAPNKDPNIVPRNLSAQQRADLVAFLKRPHTDPRAAAELPPFDRPQLYAESNRVPVITGTGRPGVNNQTPVPTAIEPPLAGNDSFTVAQPAL